MRDSGWETLLEEVSLFCNNHEIPIPGMDEVYVDPGRSRHRAEETRNLHKYRVERLCVVLDLQLQKLNNCFNEINTELLLRVASFDPRDPFARFNKEKLVQLAKFYPKEFTKIDLVILDNQLETCFFYVSTALEFLNLVGIDELAHKMVESGRHLDYSLVYLILKLVLILPVVTASVERALSAMKTRDGVLNDVLVPYLEKDVFNSVTNEKILQQFQNMRERRSLIS